jgi:hypothetical protein
LFGNLGKGLGSMKEYAFKGKDGVGLFGNLGKTFTGVTTNPDVRYDPVQ